MTPAQPKVRAADFEREERTPLTCFGQLLAQHLRACRASHLLVILTMTVGAMGMAATFFIGDGALTGLWKDMEQLMGSQISIFPDPGPNGALLKRRASVAFTVADLAALRRHVTTARYIVPHQLHRAQVEANGTTMAMMVEGISPALCGETAFRAIAGRGFSDAAQAGQLLECLITRSVETRLGLGVGRRINVDGRLFAIVGVLPDPPTADTRFQIRVIIPFVTAWVMYGKPGAYDGFVAAWNKPEDLETMLEQLRQALDACVGPDCYYLSSSRLAAQKRKGIVASVMAFGTAQAIFCVLVASIGVANVMFANVVRRRREYAIRIAMGARQADIFGLVLCESMLIGLIGGVLGIALAAAIAPAVCQALASRIHEAAALTPAFCLRGVLVPLVACGASGLLAGLVPALQIRRIDVLSILHTE